MFFDLHTAVSTRARGQVQAIWMVAHNKAANAVCDLQPGTEESCGLGYDPKTANV